MFTGIVVATAIFQKREQKKYFFELQKKYMRRVKVGSSISVNGVCLTVVKKQENVFVVELMPETERLTMFATLGLKKKVNIEFGLRSLDPLDGHIVQGHVECVGVLQRIIMDGNSHILHFIVPEKIIRYIVEKGFVAVNGISLTVTKTGTSYFEVCIIPYTWRVTMLHEIQINDLVNIESDILGRYLDAIMIHQEESIRNVSNVKVEKNDALSDTCVAQAQR